MVTACLSTWSSNPLHLNGKVIHFFAFGKVRFKRNAKLAGGPKRDNSFYGSSLFKYKFIVTYQETDRGDRGCCSFYFFISALRSLVINLASAVAWDDWWNIHFASIPKPILLNCWTEAGLPRKCRQDTLFMTPSLGLLTRYPLPPGHVLGTSYQTTQEPLTEEGVMGRDMFEYATRY